MSGNSDLDLQTSLCMVKIPNIQFNDGSKTINSELNVFQCLYGANDTMKKDGNIWMTFLSISIPNGYFTLPLTKQIVSHIEKDQVLLKDGAATYIITLPEYDDTLFELLRMYTALPDPSKVNKLVVMDNFGNEQSVVSDIPSDVDFEYQENAQIDQDTNKIIATKDDNLSAENDIMNVGERVGQGIYTLGGTLSNKIKSCSEDYIKTHEKGEGIRFSESTKKTVRNMQNATEKTYKVANYTVVKRLTKVGNSVGTSLGTKLGQYAPKEIKDLATDTMSSFMSVWDGFEAGARLVVDSGGQAMVNLVEHKYGTDAKGVAESFRKTGKYLVLMYFDYKGIGRSALLRLIGKAAITQKK